MAGVSTVKSIGQRLSLTTRPCADLHPSIGVEIHVDVPEMVVGLKYPVLPPMVVGSCTKGANADGAHRATLASVPISLQPRGASFKRPYVAFHWHPQVSGAWHVQVLSTPATSVQYSKAVHGDFVAFHPHLNGHDASL